MESAHESANNGAPEMLALKLTGDVWRGEFHDELLSAYLLRFVRPETKRCIVAIRTLAIKYEWQQDARNWLDFQEDAEVHPFRKGKRKERMVLWEL
jgi:hypothetical protein